MKFFLRSGLIVTALLMLVSCTLRAPSSPATRSTVPVRPAQFDRLPTPTLPSSPPTTTEQSLDTLFSLISMEAMFDSLTDLTSIEAYSGWRNSGTQGEREAIHYLKNNLAELAYLNESGLEINRQNFNIFLSTELWETHLYLTVNGQETEVPADGLRGPRDNIAQALRFDSDGRLNDAAPDPVESRGAILVIRSRDEIQVLDPADAQDKIIFLDYSVVDRALLGVQTAVEVASDLVRKGPAGLVLVTQFSNEPHQSHGTFVGDVSAFNWVSAPVAPPILSVRLEDLAPAGIETWADLERIEAARLIWDSDIFSPGTSQNLIARIPGTDDSQALLLTAHIDSANNPGAMDGAAGSAILLEVARILNAAQIQPATDIYLIWFGSQAPGFYGAYNFVAQHQALLDRTIALLQVESLSYPLDGITADLTLTTWSYGRLGNNTLTWPNYLNKTISEVGLKAKTENLYQLEADNIAFSAFDVPNVVRAVVRPQPASGVLGIPLNMGTIATNAECARTIHVNEGIITIKVSIDTNGTLEYEGSWPLEGHYRVGIGVKTIIAAGVEDPVITVTNVRTEVIVFLYPVAVIHVYIALAHRGYAWAWNGWAGNGCLCSRCRAKA